MTFKLTKADSERRDKLVTELQAKTATLDDAVRVYNEGLDKLRGPIEVAIADYNETLEEARGFAADIASQADQDISEKSERWQEGDRGQAASTWRDEWQNVTLDDIEAELPSDLDIEAPTHADDLENLPDAADA